MTGTKMLVTYICIDLNGNGNDSVFQYKVETEIQALKQFELETKGRYEINEVFIDK